MKYHKIKMSHNQINIVAKIPARVRSLSFVQFLKGRNEASRTVLVMGLKRKEDSQDAYEGNIGPDCLSYFAKNPNKQTTYYLK